MKEKCILVEACYVWQEVDSGSKVIMEKGASEAVRSGDAAVEFPLDHLARLDEQLGRPKWVVPVRRDDDLERLLRASIKLCREGLPEFAQ